MDTRNNWQFYCKYYFKYYLGKMTGLNENRNKVRQSIHFVTFSEKPGKKLLQNSPSQAKIPVTVPTGRIGQEKKGSSENEYPGFLILMIKILNLETPMQCEVRKGMP